MKAGTRTASPAKLFANRYLVDRCLGQGGMGSVYLVRDRLLDDAQLALKIIHSRYAGNKEYRARFRREIQLARQLSHPNIVRAFDVGVWRSRLYFTMEYVQGATLEEFVKRRRIQAERTVQLLDQIASGLEAIHEAGVVHRDLKSRNILLTGNGAVKISDFGLAGNKKARERELFGTIAYLAPEAWRGKMTPASDLYALGIIAYEILTGAPPFDNEHAAETRRLHLTVVPQRPAALRPKVPEWLDQLIMQLLAKKPADRPASARQVREVIAENLSRTTIDYSRALQIALELSDMAESPKGEKERWSESHRRLSARAKVKRLVSTKTRRQSAAKRSRRA